MPQNVLFLCTGNYYRSRFAELFFNHRAAELGLDWHATSRGLATELGHNVGPISQHTLSAIDQHNLACPLPHRSPRQVSEADLAAADLIVAVKEDEHRKMLQQRHPNWPDQVLYWHVHDLDLSTADEAIPELVELVNELVERLAR